MRALLFLIAVVSLSGCQSAPLSGSVESTRSYILEQTPRGSSWKEVEGWAKSNGWKVVPTIDPAVRVYAEHPILPEPLVIGVQWTFSKNGRLIDVLVRKTVPMRGKA